jgi:hypothetical protein
MPNAAAEAAEAAGAAAEAAEAAVAAEAAAEAAAAVGGGELAVSASVSTFHYVDRRRSSWPGLTRVDRANHVLVAALPARYVGSACA